MNKQVPCCFYGLFLVRHVGGITTLLRYTRARNDKMKTDCNPCLYLRCHYSTFGSWSPRGWSSFYLSKGVNFRYTQHLPPLIFLFVQYFSCFTLGNMQIIGKKKREKMNIYAYKTRACSTPDKRSFVYSLLYNTGFRMCLYLSACILSLWLFLAAPQSPLSQDHLPL